MKVLWREGKACSKLEGREFGWRELEARELEGKELECENVENLKGEQQRLRGKGEVCENQVRNKRSVVCGKDSKRSRSS